MKTWGTSLFTAISLCTFAVACGQPQPANDPSSSATTTSAAQAKHATPEEKAPAPAAPAAEEAKPAAEPMAPVAEEKAEPCPQDWVCVNVAMDSGKITKRDTKLIGDPKIDSTWSKNVDTRGAATFDQASKPVDVTLRLPQSKPGEHLANVFIKVKGREILLDKHSGEEFTYVGVIAAEKDGQFMVDLRYMR